MDSNAGMSHVVDLVEAVQSALRTLREIHAPLAECEWCCRGERGERVQQAPALERVAGASAGVLA